MDTFAPAPAPFDAPRGDPADHTGLTVLSLAECMARLACRRVGRLGFMTAGSIVIVPVHHVMVGATPYFRTRGNIKIGLAGDRAPVAYEVDDFGEHPDGSVWGWSVCLSGIAYVVTDRDLIERLDALDHSPWPWGQPDEAAWVGVVAEEVSGREIPARSPTAER